MRTRSMKTSDTTSSDITNQCGVKLSKDDSNNAHLDENISYVPNLPDIQIVPNEWKHGSKWKKSERLVIAVVREIEAAYEEIVYFRQNIMPLPSGAIIKEFICELTLWLKHLNEPTSQFNSFSLKAFMIMTDLLLQKPNSNSKAKDNSLALKRRLAEWNNGNVMNLLKEAQFIQHKFNHFQKINHSSDKTAKTFAGLIGQGKINAAMKVLDNTSSAGLHDITPSVIEDLRKKHPNPSPIKDPETLLYGPIAETECYLYDDIDEQCILRAAMRITGAAGPSGVHADMLRSLLCSNRHASESKELREQIAVLTRNLLLRTYHSELIEPLVACRLIPLAKKPSGIRPIGVGETLRRLMGKTVSWVLNEEIKSAAGPLQTCANHGAGAEAAIHGMREIYENESTEAVLLIDASNAFNCLNRAAAIHNIQILCPRVATYIINTYREPSRLFVSGKNGQTFELLSQEGTTQATG